jgi:dihydrofolate synthase/folylpolyglutamate synthase
MPAYPEILARMFELQKFGMKFGLDSMLRILSNLGDPHLGARYVHVAGTNGKGSSAAMLASILNRSGLRAGLYTSPHLVTFRERIQLGGVPISEKSVAALSEEVWAATDPGSPPTFFEFVTAMAILHFRREGADVAVMEAGLGGRLDSTNVITPMAAAVTNVSLEHTEQLGTTVARIAMEKAGIIKAGVPFVGGRITGEALAVIGGRLKALGVADARLLGRDYRAAITGADDLGRPVFDYQGPRWSLAGLKPALAGPYQAENAALALALAERLEEAGLPVGPESAAPGLASVGWPGRAETFAAGAWPPGGGSAAPLLLDGAHNPGSAAALATLLADRPRERLHMIFGVMADKDVGAVAKPLVPLADRLYLTRPVYRRAADPEVLLERLTAAIGPPPAPTSLHHLLPEAIRAAAREAGPRDLVVICGSLFTVGEARAFLTGEPSVESN